MKFISLEHSSEPSSLSDAIVSGLAPDGGLYVPEHWPDHWPEHWPDHWPGHWPDLRHDPASLQPGALLHGQTMHVQPLPGAAGKVHEPLFFDSSWSTLSFDRFAARVLAPFFEGDVLAPWLDTICETAFDFPIVLKDLGAGKTLLELFHGPTGAFKDFGARFLALCMNAIPDPRAQDRLVLVATSGDTGGAVAAAFCSCTQIPVAILYPKNGVSPRQEKQLTVWGSQVRAFAVDGSFDDCQRIVKEALASNEWQSKHQLISANSINLARLLPQMAYFAYASLHYKLRHGVAAELIIPSGNMGNASAALWAKRLGFPIRHITFAHNENRAVPNYFATGTWQPLATVSTLANAMDVGNPSNFARVRRLFENDAELKRHASALSVSDDDIRKTIQFARAQWSEIVCPHTATAVFAGEKLDDPHWIAAATAHPAKFESILEPLLNDVIAVPPALRSLLQKESARTEIAASLASFTGAWNR